MKYLAFLLAILTSVAHAQSPSPAMDPLSQLERAIEVAPRPPQLTDPGVGPYNPPLLFHEHPAPHHHPEPHRHQEHDYLQAFRIDFIQRAMAAGLLAGGICAWLGVFVVLRRMVFVGVSLAQVASAGVAFAVFFDWNPVLVSTLATVFFSVMSGLVRLKGALSPESRIGLVYVLSGSIAIILLSKSGTGEAEQLEMLQGSLLTVGTHRVRDLAVVAVMVATLHHLGLKRLIAVSFDPLTAHVAGVRVWLWNLVLFFTLGCGISVSIQSCGLLLVFGYLLIPAATGLVTGCRIPGVFGLAMLCQSVSTIVGLWGSYEWDWPPGPAIVMAMMAFLCLVTLLTALFRPVRLNRIHLPSAGHPRDV